MHTIDESKGTCLYNFTHDCFPKMGQHDRVRGILHCGRHDRGMNEGIRERFSQNQLLYLITFFYFYSNSQTVFSVASRIQIKFRSHRLEQKNQGFGAPRALNAHQCDCENGECVTGEDLSILLYLDVLEQYKL